MEDPYGDGASMAQEVQRLAKLVKRSGQASRSDAAGAGADACTTSSMEDDLSAMSKRLLAWVEMAAAAAAAAASAGSNAGGDVGEEYHVFPPVLLESFCRYMEALATAFPGQFSADCQSLARPVASCLLKAMAAHGSKVAAATAAAAKTASLPHEDAKGEPAAGNSDENGLNKSPQLPPPPATTATPAGQGLGLPPPTTTTVNEQEEDTVRDGNSGKSAGGGGGTVQSSSAGTSNVSVTVEERRALELWVEMLGICLLPFCGSGRGGRTISGSDQSGANKSPIDGGTVNNGDSRSHDPRVSDTEQAEDPFDSDSEEEEDDDDHGDRGGKPRGSDGGEGKSRSGWVAGWMRRAGVAVAGPLECPLDVRPGGRDEDLPCRLAALIASHAKAAAGASRPSSVSSLTTVLGVLVAFTASSPSSLVGVVAPAERRGSDGGLVAHIPPEGSRDVSWRQNHEAVVEEAFSCLTGLAGAAPESSAQAECVKAALVALRECAQAARLSCVEDRVPAALSMLEGVPSRLKLLLTRSKSQGQKAYSTARSFCREALAAAVACARKLIGLAGAAAIAGDPRWFLNTFVVKMASPLLLGDAVGALRAAAAAATASAGSTGIDKGAACQADGIERCSNGEMRASDGLEGVELAALREVILPGATDRLTKALRNIDRYSAAAAKEVLKATGCLIQAAGGEIRPFRNRLGMAFVDCAVASKGRPKGGGGAEMDEKARLCLRGIRRLGRAAALPGDKPTAADTAVDGTSDPSSGQSFPEAALDLTCGVVEREWLGKTGDRGDREGNQNDEDNADESIITLVEAHVTLVALLRSSSMRVPGLPGSNASGGGGGSVKDGGREEWPAAARRLAKLAWAIAFRVRKATGTVEASMALADDDVMLLCQGLEVLEALSDCSGDFFEGRQSKLLFFEGDLAPVLATLRGCHDKNNMHPVVFDACSWVESAT